MHYEKTKRGGGGRGNKAINNGRACSVLFLSMAGLFTARIKILDETQTCALTFF